MGQAFKKKSDQELDVIIQEMPPNSGTYQAARSEINRRTFWKRDVISWVSLLFGGSSLIIHLLKYING